MQGLGIALVAAQRAGVPVKLIDTSQASIDKGLKFAGTTYDLLRENMFVDHEQTSYLRRT